MNLTLVNKIGTGSLSGESRHVLPGPAIGAKEGDDDSLHLFEPFLVLGEIPLHLVAFGIRINADESHYFSENSFAESDKHRSIFVRSGLVASEPLFDLVEPKSKLLPEDLHHFKVGEDSVRNRSPLLV